MQISLTILPRVIRPQRLSATYRRHVFRVLAVVAAVAGAVAPGARAQGVGDLGVSPTRIVLEGRSRTAQVSLLNKGSGTVTYRISVVNMRMTEEGTIERIEEPDAGQQFAQQYLRFAPRQVVLEPGAVQTVRILLRKPKGLPTGEYRSHLYFSAVPKPNTGRNVEMVNRGDGIRISLTVIPGVTIPVIVRHGDLTASASLSSLTLVRPTDANGKVPHASVRIGRTGDRSLFGDVTVTYRNGTGGTEYVLAKVNQLAVYTPNPSRRLVLRLRIPQGVTLSGGRLQLVFRARSEDGGQVLAQTHLDIP